MTIVSPLTTRTLIVLFLSAAFLLTSPVMLTAQEDPVAVNLPLAPTAAGIAKYGDIPVSESTGIPSVGVPITSLNHRGLNIDVSLSYHAGGIRVSDEASWVGLGWSISGDGMITRAIRGHDDFAPRSPTPASRQPVLGYLDALDANRVPFAPDLDDWFGGSDGIRYQGGYRFSRFVGASEVNNFSNYCDADNNNNVDMQSDLYSFNFPGGSGKFFINKNKEPQLVDAGDMTISFERSSNGLVSWVITSGTGYSYHFGGDRELTQFTSNYTSSLGGQNTPLAYKYMSAWYIEKIVTPQGEEIKYDYHFKEKSIFPVPGYSDSKMDRIVGMGGQIQDFVYNNPFERAYIGCDNTQLSRTISGQRYDEITLSSITAPYGKIIFKSDYERSDLTGGRKLFAVEQYSNHKLIRSVKLYHENVQSINKKKGYEFYLSLSGDDHHVLFFQEGIQSFKYTSDLISSRLVLKKVEVVGDDGGSTLPTHEFEYDRISELPSKTSLGIDAFGFYNGQDDNRMLAPAMEIANPAGGSISMAGADRDTRPNKAKTGVISKITYPTGGETHFEFESTDYNSQGNHYGPGLRITSLVDYSAPGTFAKRVSYDYRSASGVSNGRIYNKPDLSYTSLRVCEDRWEGNTTLIGNIPTVIQEGTIECGGGIQSGNEPSGAYRVMIRQSGSVTPVSSTNFGNVVVYSSVTKRLENQDKTKNIGKVVSQFHANFGNGAAFVDQFRGMTAPLFVDPIIGSPISRETFDKTGNLVQKVEYEVISTETGTPNWNTSLRFDRLVFDYFANDASANPQTYLNVCESIAGFCTPFDLITNYISPRPFPTFAMYADHTYWVRTLSTETTEYREDGGQIVTTESTDYNDVNYAVASTSVSRAGAGKTTSYRYAHELGNDYQFLVDAHMTSVPVEVTAPNGDIFTTEYSPQYLVPRKFFQRFSSSDLITRSSVEDFYPLGYPKEVLTFGLDIPQQYTWVDGQITQKDVDGYVQEYHYDDKRRLEHSVGVDGLVTSYYYDALQRTEKVVSRKTSLTDPTERVSVSYDYVYGPGQNSVTTTAEFDDAPSVTSISIFDGLGRSVSETVENVEKGRSVYDEFGRVEQTLYMPGYGMSSIGYDDSPLMRVKSNNPPDQGRIRFNHFTDTGNTRTETIDEKGHSSFATTDVFGRTLEQEDHLGNKTIYLGYTADDQPLGIKPPVGPEYSYTYTTRHLLESKTIPGGGTTRFGYDINNRLKSTAMPNQMVIGVAYDYLGREVRTFKLNSLSSGQPYAENYTGEDLLTTTTFGTSGITKGKITASAAALLLPGGEIGSMVTTDLSGFDEVGRPKTSTENYQLDGETFTDITNLNYDSRDLILQSTFSHSDVSLSQTTNFDVFTRPTDVSSTLKLIPEGLTGSMNISMQYNGADQLMNRKLMKAQKGFYQEQYAYGPRGWLEAINTPAPRTFDAILCEEPTGDVYEQEFTEEPTPIVDIFTALNNGDPVSIPELDCEFEEPPVGDCQYDADVRTYVVLIGNPTKKGRGLFANTANIACPSGTTCSPLARSQNLGTIDNIVITGIGLDSDSGPLSLSFGNTYSLNEILLSSQQEGANKPVLQQFRNDMLQAANASGWFLREVGFSVKSDADNCVSCQADGAKNYGLEITFHEAEAKLTHLEVAYTYRTQSEPDVATDFVWSLPATKKGDGGIKPVPCLINVGKKFTEGATAGAKLENKKQSWDEWFEQQLKIETPAPLPFLNGRNLRETTNQHINPVGNGAIMPLRTRIIVSPTDISSADSTLISETRLPDCPEERTDLRASSTLNARASTTAQDAPTTDQQLTITRTLTEIRFREAKTTLSVRLSEEGLPYHIHQGELSETQTEENEAEKERIERTLQSWLLQRLNGRNDVSVAIDEKGKLTILLESNELEFVVATYSSAYFIGTTCPDGTTETIEIAGEATGLVQSQLLHRNGSESATSDHTPVRHLAQRPWSKTPSYKTPSTTKSLTGTDCGTINEPTCSKAQTAAQLEQVNRFHGTTDQDYLDGLSYPTTLQSVMLCDGSIVYLLADQVETLQGNFVVLNQLTLNSPNDLVNTLIRDQRPTPLFSLQLEYEKNGNISAAEWKTTYFSPKRYEYKYDELNRIKSAAYNQTAAGPNSDLADDLFSVSDITYDPIGNIQTLTRRGMTGCGPDLKKGEIDILTYDYGSDNDSQLRKITDAAPDEALAAQGVSAKDGGEYGYDVAGRMTGDPYRGLTIRYNHLDLPREIDSPTGLIQITYDANGQKRLYHVENKYTRRYAGPLTFEKPADKDDYTLEAAATGDGRLVYDEDFEEIYPEYHHRDHLGNTRLAFTDRNEDKLVEIIGNGNEVTQVLDFYPFGLQQQGEGVFGPPTENSNRAKFNGIEHTNETGLDMAPFRAYDAAIGRWTQVDPLAELVPSLTSYRFGFNNPISFKDPIGLFEESGPGGYTMRQSRRAKRKNARAKRSSQRKARRKRNRSARRQRRNARQQDNHRESYIRAVESVLLEKAHQDAENLLVKLNMVDEANDMPVPSRQSGFAGLPRNNLDVNTWSGTGPCILNVGGCNIFASDITHNARGVNNRLNKIVRIGHPGPFQNQIIASNHAARIYGPKGGNKGNGQTIIGAIIFTATQEERYYAIMKSVSVDLALAQISRYHGSLSNFPGAVRWLQSQK